MRLTGPRRGRDGEYPAAVIAESGTWHYGLIAHWWAEFNVADPEELAYFRAAIRRFGEPALDLGCGTGRILVPLLADGLDVDGSDISADMITAAQAQAAKHGFTPRLTVQPMHQLDLRGGIGRSTCVVRLASVAAVTTIERGCDVPTGTSSPAARS